MYVVMFCSCCTFGIHFNTSHSVYTVYMQMTYNIIYPEQGYHGTSLLCTYIIYLLHCNIPLHNHHGVGGHYITSLVTDWSEVMS